jgi:hypothetical protein
MKAATVDIGQYFRPVIGVVPWRVKPGVGSFLTFDFGRRTRDQGHLRGQWHLWIYLSNWSLFHGDRQLVDSDADRKRITISSRRLEQETFSAVDFDRRTQQTTFFFNDFRLVVSPVDYLENVDDRDDYWIFFMPNNEVLAAGPSGIHVEQGNARHSSSDRRKQGVEIHAAGVRQVRLTD